MSETTPIRLGELRFLAKSGPCWQRVPRNTDPELEAYIADGLVVHRPGAGYSLTPKGRKLVEREATPRPCTSCNGTGVAHAPSL